MKSAKVKQNSIAIALALACTIGAAQAQMAVPAMPAVPVTAEQTTAWMNTFSDPKMIENMLKMADPKMLNQWITMMTDPKMIDSMMKMADPKIMNQ